MATTTNYGWTTPDDTSLVKDGAAAIRTLGSSVDTTTKALNPSTTLGDIEYRSATANTNTRLGIGTSGQVLSVSGGVPAWTTPAGSSLTIAQIATGTLTSGSELSLTGLSSYDTLEFRISGINVSADAVIGVRINGNTGSNYEYAADQNRQNASFSANDPSTKQQLSDVQFDPMDAFQDSAQTTNQYRVRFTNCKATGFTLVSGLYVYRWDQSGTARPAIASWSGIYKVAEAVSSIQFRTTGGATFSAGSYTIWGG